MGQHLVMVVTKLHPTAKERAPMQSLEPWHGRCRLQFQTTNGSTKHQGGCTAPFKLLRADVGDHGRCELPLLHTAGGLVGSLGNVGSVSTGGLPAVCSDLFPTNDIDGRQHSDLFL